MPTHSFLLSKFFLFFCLFGSNVEAIEKASLFAAEIPEKQFDQLWKERCLDTGERVLEMYLPTSSRSWGAYENYLNFHSAIVSDHYVDKGYQCYRNGGLSRSIIEWKDGLPFVLSVSPYIEMDDVFDFVSASPTIDAKSYVDYAMSTADPPIPAQTIMLLLYQNHGIWRGIHDARGTKPFILDKKDTNTFVRRDISPFEGIYDYPNTNGFGYDFSGKYLRIYSVRKDQILKTSDNTWSVSIYNGELRPTALDKKFLITIPAKLKKSSQRLKFITTELGKNIQSLHGRENKNWINDQGYLTLENGKKQKTSNHRRLEVWLKRYLTRQKVKLELGKTYYFNTDLGGYLLMDYYKENGEPIYAKPTESICKRFEEKLLGFKACER